MKAAAALFTTLLFATIIHGRVQAQDFRSWSATPPMGWNSWDCYGPTVTEEEVKANADYMAEHLKPYGWEYVVVDIRWFVANDKAGGYNQDDPVYVLDAYGRYLPAENRFPSAAGGAGFKPLADYVHSKGLKFGIPLSPISGAVSGFVAENWFCRHTPAACSVFWANNRCLFNPILCREGDYGGIFPEDGPVEVAEFAAVPGLNQFFQFFIGPLGVIIGLEVVVKKFGYALPEAGRQAAFVIFDDVVRGDAGFPGDEFDHYRALGDGHFAEGSLEVPEEFFLDGRYITVLADETVMLGVQGAVYLFN